MRALPLVLVALMVLAPITGASALSIDTAPHSPTDSVTQSPTDSATQTPTDSVTQSPNARRGAKTTDNVSVSNHTTANQIGQVLSIPAGEIQQSTTGEQHVDLGPAIEFGASASAAQMRTLTVIERVEQTDGSAERERRIKDSLDTIEQRTTELHEREQAAIQAYGAGELAPREFLIELARIDARAGALENRRSRLAQIANQDEEIELDRGRLAALERRIDALTGPVRERARVVLQGQAATNRFFIATGPDSLVLSTISTETYYREAFRGDRYAPTSTTDIDPDMALDITAESYPTLWELRQNNTGVVGSQGNYLVRMPHERGMLQAFVDGDNRAVYKEFQTRPLDSFENVRTTSATRDGLNLSANYTYPGGPVRLRLVDAETGDPVDANVTLAQNGEESELLARSGTNGVVWTLSPEGEYTITAIRGNNVVVLTISPADPPRAGEMA
jgi:hypothetical protein